MIIQDGYDGQPLEIRVSKSSSGNAEIWIEQHAFNQIATKEYSTVATTVGMDKLKEGDTWVGRHLETLSYATLQELVDLRDELNSVIKDIVGV